MTKKIHNVFSAVFSYFLRIHLAVVFIMTRYTVKPAPEGSMVGARALSLLQIHKDTEDFLVYAIVMMGISVKRYKCYILETNPSTGSSV